MSGTAGSAVARPDDQRAYGTTAASAWDGVAGGGNPRPAAEPEEACTTVTACTTTGTGWGLVIVGVAADSDGCLVVHHTDGDTT